LVNGKKARDKFLACLFFACTDRERYKEVIDDLGNDYSLGNINYPEDVSGMVSLVEAVGGYPRWSNDQFSAG
jgi:hypothetical protein